MEKIKDGWFYIAADGDGIGKLVGRAVIANDVEELHKVSNKIDAAQDFILHWCKSIDGIKISGGGDEFTAAIPPEAKDDIKDLRACIEKSFGYTISVGVGRSLSEAGTALLVAKLRGKDRIVYFNKHIKEDIKKAKRRVREGRASQEEYKLSEAYLEKSEFMGKICNLHKKEHHKKHIHTLHKHEEGYHDPHTEAGINDALPFNPDEENNRTDDCAYCQDLDAEENANGTAGMHNCDMCQDYDAKNGTTGGMDDCPACKEYEASQQNTGGIDDCPYCQTENIEGGQADPQNFQGSDHICNCPNCPKKDQTNVAVEDMGAEHPDNCPECQELYSSAVENQPSQTGEDDPNLQGHETAEQVLNLLDQEPGAGAQTPEEAAKKIDNTELPQGDQMKENVSVKEDFGPAQKGDVSDSEQVMSQPGHDCDCPDCPGSQQAVPMNESDSQNQDEPDMTSVLKDGLDDHANEQKRAAVVNQVAQTLMGFKANKEFLETAKKQNPGLYQSTIGMLKAMIALCDLLGLKPQAQTMAADQGTIAESTQAGAPDKPKAAAPQEGAASGPKTQAG